MTKQAQFLTIVQCGILAHVKDSQRPAAADCAMDLMGKAIELAPTLPADLTATEAAKQFVDGDGNPDWRKPAK
jgi:hypothetical protein